MANEKILVVDDDVNICELLRLYLTKEGYQVTIANDGEEGLDKFNQVKPDMVLLDVMMPRMDGLEVCRRIRKLGNTPVMMLTAKGETFDKVLGLELGADDYMVKPFDAKEVVARIKAVLRRCQQDDAARLGHADDGGLVVLIEQLFDGQHLRLCPLDDLPDAGIHLIQPPLERHSGIGAHRAEIHRRKPVACIVHNAPSHDGIPRVDAQNSHSAIPFLL